MRTVRLASPYKSTRLHPTHCVAGTCSACARSHPLPSQLSSAARHRPRPNPRALAEYYATMRSRRSHPPRTRGCPARKRSRPTRCRSAPSRGSERGDRSRPAGDGTVCGLSNRTRASSSLPVGASSVRDEKMFRGNLKIQTHRVTASMIAEEFSAAVAECGEVAIEGGDPAGINLVH